MLEKNEMYVWYLCFKGAKCRIYGQCAIVSKFNEHLQLP